MPLSNFAVHSRATYTFSFGLFAAFLDPENKKERKEKTPKAAKLEDLEEPSQPQTAAGLGQQVAGVNKLENDLLPLPVPLLRLLRSGKKRREAK